MIPDAIVHLVSPQSISPIRPVSFHFEEGEKMKDISIQERDSQSAMQQTTDDAHCNLVVTPAISADR